MVRVLSPLLHVLFVYLLILITNILHESYRSFSSNVLILIFLSSLHLTCPGRWKNGRDATTGYSNLVGIQAHLILVWLSGKLTWSPSHLSMNLLFYSVGKYSVGTNGVLL